MEIENLVRLSQNPDTDLAFYLNTDQFLNPVYKNFFYLSFIKFLNEKHIPYWYYLYLGNVPYDVL
jgi:hypothetical protein